MNNTYNSTAVTLRISTIAKLAIRKPGTEIFIVVLITSADEYLAKALHTKSNYYIIYTLGNLLDCMLHY